MPSDASTYVSTPYGLVTAAGRRYHIPEEAVREYAGAVLDHVSLETLVRWADVWVDSPRTVTLWAVPLLLWGLPNGGAVGGAVGVYVAWMFGSPAVPRIGGARVLAGLGHVGVQGGYYGLALSMLAVKEQFAAVGIGLVAFIMLRWGIVDWGGRALRQRGHRWFYPLPVTDQVLRGLIIQAALKYRVSVPQVDALTNDIIENWGTQTEATSERDAPPSSSSN